jgi:hypothetical protein
MTDELPRLTKREWDALGSLLLPISLGGKIKLGPKTAIKLESLGLVEPFEQTLPPGPNDPSWLRVKINGWRMTPWGHFIYCRWASQNTEGEND